MRNTVNPHGPSVRPFSRLPGRLAFCLKDAIPHSAIEAGHIFLGFSKCGQVKKSSFVCILLSLCWHQRSETAKSRLWGSDPWPCRPSAARHVSQLLLPWWIFNCQVVVLFSNLSSTQLPGVQSLRWSFFQLLCFNFGLCHLSKLYCNGWNCDFQFLLSYTQTTSDIDLGMDVIHIRYNYRLHW